MTLNAFGNFNGDLVFPALAPYLNNAATTPALSLDNTAMILNEIVTTAATGENATNAANSAITTGDATTAVSLYNNINTNLVNDNVRVLFNVHGNWNGVVFGLPENVAWFATPQGYILDIEGTPTAKVSPGVTSVTATNTAVINNRINVAANTGGNQVHDADTALISTGNAFAGVNVVNVANANIVGQNWMLAIVNVFGDFNGSVSFGRPDVWVGGAVTVPKQITKDTGVSYTYTVKNNGDARASTITVSDTISPHIKPTTIGDAGAMVDDSTIEWEIDSLEPGESVTVTYQGTVTTNAYNTEISNIISSTLAEPDDNYVNNTEIVTFYTSKNKRTKSAGFTYYGQADEVEPEEENAQSAAAPITALQMKRTPLVATVTSKQPDTIQTIQIFNDTDLPVYNALFLDQLYDANSQLIHEERVQLGTVLPNEEVTFSYTLSFNHKATPPLQTYSFDSVFFDGTEQNVLTRNGYVNHLADVQLSSETSTASVGFEFAGITNITSTSSTLARVLGTTTSATGTIASWPAPLVPLIGAGVGTQTGGKTPPAISPTDLVFPFLLLLLLLSYLCLRYRPEFLQLPRSVSFKLPLW